MEAFARTGDVAAAARKAGYSTPEIQGYEIAKRPAVQAEIARRHVERLFNEVLPLALDVHIEVLRNPHTPAGARVQAVKLAYDRTIGLAGADATKEPHEMTGEELAKRLEQLKREAADRAKPVQTIEPDPPAQPSIFE